MILHDCKLHGPEVDNELFVVEGVSAAANVKRACDEKFQAVLALQGKPVNAAKASRARVEKHPGLQVLRSALGCGMDEHFNLKMLRYKRVILLFDPDADGIHCSALVQIFLQQFMPKLLAAEKVHLVRAPLFAVSLSKGTEEPIIAYSQNHYDKVCEHLVQTYGVNYQTTRFKGVASLSVSLLRKTCLIDESRKAQVLSSQDALLAVRVFGGI